MTLTQAFEDACSRFDGKAFATLSDRDQLLVAIWGLEAEVNNGGFDQYYFNGAGDQARFVPSALKQIGAHDMAEIVERANAVFGADGPPVDRDERQEVLLALTEENEEAWQDLDEEFQAYPDDIARLLVKHLGLSSAG